MTSQKMKHEEGDTCPACETGELNYKPPVNCSCHLGGAPCSACTDAPLACDNCGQEYRNE